MKQLGTPFGLLLAGHCNMHVGPVILCELIAVSTDGSVTSSQTSSNSSSAGGGMLTSTNGDNNELMARSMSEFEPTTTAEHMNLTLRDGTRLNVDIVDVHGTPRRRALHAHTWTGTPALPSLLTLRDASAVVLVYAIDDERSWSHLDTLMRQLKHACPPDCDVLIIANKCDRLMHNARVRHMYTKCHTIFSANFSCGAVTKGRRLCSLARMFVL